MASSTSRDSDLKRKISACSSSSVTDFLRGNARDNNLVSDSEMANGFSSSSYVDRNQGLDQGQGHRSLGKMLNERIKLLDAVGAVTPIIDGEADHPKVVRKTVDDVWKEIIAGKKSIHPPKEEMMTLEDFLVKAGAVEEEQEAASAKRGIGERSLSLLEPLDRAAQQRQRRMIKNRESAAWSRERKQAYQVELESMTVRLEEENEQLLREKAELTKKRLKQLMENVIPRSGEKKATTPRLRRIRSMQW
ncbi:hypothetical protein ABFS83_02G075400 [Erythranthe nasuta]